VNAIAFARILRKDSRRYWILLFAAAALDILSTLAAFGGSFALQLSDSLGSDSIESFRKFLVGFVAVLAAQDDPATGERGDWVARPITPSALLGAKLSFFALGMALPVGLVSLAAMRGLHESAFACLTAGCAAAAETLEFALACALLGALTRSLLSAASVLVALAVAHLLTERNLGSLLTLIQPNPTFGSFRTGPSQLTVEVVGGTFWMLTLGFLLVHQYVSRRTARTLVLGAGLIPAAWVTIALWRWELFSHGGMPAPASPTALAIDIINKDRHAFIGEVEHAAFPLKDQVRIALPVRKSSGSTIDEVSASRIQSRFRPLKGAPFEMPRPSSAWAPSMSSVMFAELDMYPTLWAALGAPRAPIPAQDISINVLEMPRALYESLRGAQGTLESAVEFEAYRFRGVATLPLRPGASASSDGAVWQFQSLVILPRGNAEITVHFVQTLKNERWQMFVLVNEVRGEIAVGRSRGGRYVVTRMLLAQSEPLGFHQVWSLATRSKHGVVDAAWLEGATLKAIESLPTGKSVRRVVWEDIELPDAPVRE